MIRGIRKPGLRPRLALPYSGAVPNDGSRGAVVVTGSSTGIGRACALHLDRLGFTVFAGVRKESDTEALRATASERLEPLILDVTEQDQIAAAAERVSEASPSGLAGLGGDADLGEGEGDGGGRS